MFRYRWAVLAGWLVVLAAAGVFLAPKAPAVVKSGGFRVPGSESIKAAQALERDFHGSSYSTSVVVYQSSSLTVTDADFQTAVSEASARMRTVRHVRAVLDFTNTANPALVSQDGHSTFAIVDLDGSESEDQEAVGELRSQLRGTRLDHYITGAPAVNYDIQIASEDDLHRAELVTIPLVLVLLLLVFRTVVAAVVPLLLGASAVVLSNAGLYLIASRTDVSVFSLNVASMIGLGLGIDFSLIVLTRFREELPNAPSVEEAVARTMQTAGRSITYSGITVVLGMLLLTLLIGLTVPASISMGVMLVAVAAVLVGLTVLPALMSVVGKRIEWLRVIPRRAPRADPRTVIWYRLSRLIMHRPWPWLLGAIALLAVIAFPLHSLATTGADPRLLPSNMQSVVGVKKLNATFGANRLTPIQVVVKTKPDGVWTPEFLDAIGRLSQTAAAESGVDSVQSLYTVAVAQGLTPDQYRQLKPSQFPAGPQRNALTLLVDIDGRNDSVVVNVFSPYDQFDSRHQDTIYRLRGTTVPEALKGTGYTAYVGGSGAAFLDFRDTEFARFPAVVGGVLLMTFVILMMFFQSLFLPLKAILMNVASIVASYGALVAIFVYGWGGRVLGFEPSGHLSVITPPILFAVLFGLSADYEVFMLSRVKEIYDETHDNMEAVAGGLARTAGVITAAALLLLGVFGSFSVAGVQTVKEVGVGLAIGVVLDTTVVRIIMVPATMRLLGDANWWMPNWLKRFVPKLTEGPAPAPAPAPSPVAAVASTPLARLRGMAGAAPEAPVELAGGRSLRIGRDAANDIQLLAPQVSRFHARIDVTPSGHALIDLNSRNGVFVNRTRIPAVPGSRQLDHGDRIQLGLGGPELVYEQAAVSAPPPAS